jgi:hypothetical protein
MQAPEDCNDGDYYINPGISIGPCEQEWPGDYNCNGVPDSSECMTPIVVDMKGDGFSLTTKPGGVIFDLVGSGIPKQIPWTTNSSDDVWLAMDRNGNGRIDSGKELWGAPTDQPPSHSRNGYIALAEFDLPKNGGNDDGVIDRRDAVFLKLLLWRDANHDGVSQTTELSLLLESAIRSIDLDYIESPEVDDFGNWLRYQSTATVCAPRIAQRRTCDVYLWAQ